MHAIVERFPAGWCVTDLGSSNGTGSNQIRIGQTRLIFHGPLALSAAQTAPPSLTTRERDVLVALCRPPLDRDMFTEPASTRAIADELVITQAAVKQHLANLYDKFGYPATDSNRRARLANDALRRGAVSLNQLRAHDDQ